MSKEDISRLYVNQIKNSQNNERKNISFGMGLKLSKEFVENNNGEMWIEGEPGKCTTVLFTLNKLDNIS